MTAVVDRTLAMLERPAPETVLGQLVIPHGLRIGSLCTGYGGLDMAVREVFGGHLAWVADPDPGATAILAHHHPDTPNLGDITALDWWEVEPVDVLCAGYPCQPFSVAGLRKGAADARHLWPHIARALRVLRPRIAVFENVAGHLRLGFDTVLADLAGLGFDAEWCTVRASEVGAPHRRERLFVLAWPADAHGPRLEGPWLRGAVAEHGGPAADTADLGHERARHTRDGRPGPADDRGAAADAAGPRRGARRAGADLQPVEPDKDGGSPTDAAGVRHGYAGAARVGGLEAAPVCGGAPAAADADGIGRGAQQLDLRARESNAEWDRFAPAIARWEAVLGRMAPRAVDDRGRLSPHFVEWLMGLPAGHVTAVPGLTRTQQLHALGNGVVWQQGAAALRLLRDRAGVPLSAIRIE